MIPTPCNPCSLGYRPIDGELHASIDSIAHFGLVFGWLNGIPTLPL